MFLIITVVRVSGSCVSVSVAAAVAASASAASGCLNSYRVSHPPLQPFRPLPLPARRTAFVHCCLPDADAGVVGDDDSETGAGEDDAADTTMVMFFPPLPFRWLVPALLLQPLDRSPELDFPELLLSSTTPSLALPAPDDDGGGGGDCPGAGKGRHAVCSLGGVGAMGRGGTKPRLRAI